MKIKIILVIILITLSVGILYFYQNFINPKPQLIGGDKDAGGCLIGAGYSWCEVKNKCLRVWEEKCELSTDSTTKSASCSQKGGVWYPKENLCEVNKLSESQCITEGGQFNGCASACRHDPKAEVCTMQCVLTCTFR
ncbi:MAG: hypothetical protein WC933_02000 [Candidatus Paceibacterota bacterium]|jgi:hypothetical protein